MNFSEQLKTGLQLNTQILASIIFIALSGHTVLSAQRGGASQASLQDYKARIPLMRAQISIITNSAQISAERIMEKPAALLNVPYWEQPSVAEELLNRAGGLALALPTIERAADATDRDVVLLSVRSWDQDGTNAVKLVNEYRKKGWFVNLFASRIGCPTNLVVDAFIDNGAPSPGKEQGRINVLANATLGWMWCCEYTSAMTRKGKIPGILMSVGLPEGDAYNQPIQSREGRHFMGTCSTPIPAGELAEKYLHRVETLVADLESAPRQKQIKKASDIIAKRMKAGKTVGLAGVGHLILFEAELDNQAPWKGFSGVAIQQGQTVPFLKPGDLLMWIAYSGGLNSKYCNFASAIKKSQLDVISSFTADPRSPVDNGEVKPLAHIDQTWAIGDSEIPLPCPPGRMAPISGLNSVLIQRMLDDEVAARLAR